MVRDEASLVLPSNRHPDIISLLSQQRLEQLRNQTMIARKDVNDNRRLLCCTTASTSARHAYQCARAAEHEGQSGGCTGASDGLGYAAIEAVAEAGADVVLWYNSNDIAIQKAEHLAKTHSIRAKAYQCEVSQVEQVRASIDKVVADFGRHRRLCRQRRNGPSRSLSWSRRWKSTDDRRRSTLMASSIAQNMSERSSSAKARESDHHIEHVCAHRQRARRSAIIQLDEGGCNTHGQVAGKGKEGVCASQHRQSWVL